MCLVQHFLTQFFSVRLQFPEVDPLEICPLQGRDPYIPMPGILSKLPNKLVIFLDIGQARIQPIFSMVPCGLCGNRSEEIRVSTAVSRKHLVKALPAGLIWNQNTGKRKSRQVKCLGWGVADRTIFRKLFPQRSKHMMPVAGEYQITVDLVRNHKHVVLAADLAQFPKLFFRIDAPHRITLRASTPTPAAPFRKACPPGHRPNAKRNWQRPSGTIGAYR